MSAKSSVLLLGCGGVGTIVALNLERGGLATVTAVLRSNYADVKRRGFHIQSCDHGELHEWRPSHLVDHVPSYQDHKFDYIVCTTKNTPDCKPTLSETIAPAVTPNHTVIVLLQNGINLERALFDAFPSNTVLSGISYIRSHEVSPGEIDHMDHDELICGPFSRVPQQPDEKDVAAARKFCEIYGAAGRTISTYDEDVLSSRWRKLMYNACLNSVCAVTGLDTGSVQQTGTLVDGLVRPAMKEIVAAARAAGAKNMSDETVEATIAGLEPVEMRFKPSMLVDMEKGNYTEFENIVGEPLRAGTALGVQMPTLSVVYNILQAFQWRLKMQKGHEMPELCKTDSPMAVDDSK
ncbi:hypothetical protein AAFC00_003339 [Neodothiora populina]|uniref:2-dehydropantoate 2-reductase n=1 Tax=Neodothiora populina TaxID=2781224 RepID=A0ABR3PA34_9PEZI